MSLILDGVNNVHPAWLKAEISERFGSIAALAAKYRVNPNTVQAAIIRPQPTGNHIIASALGYRVHQLWPQWFSPSGMRIRKGNVKRASAARARQKGAVA